VSCPHCRPKAPGASTIIATSSPPPASTTTAAATPAPRRSIFRRGVRKTGWMIPGIVLILMPKCPLCLAAYIALLTGISIPFPAAAWLRLSLIVGCVASLAWLLARQLAQSRRS
jgi:hypothetical protein